MRALLTMSNRGGVVASLIATDDVDPAIVDLTFRVAAPGQAPREELFGPEGTHHVTEILDLMDGLRTLLEQQGFPEQEKSHVQ